MGLYITFCRVSSVNRSSGEIARWCALTSCVADAHKQLSFLSRAACGAIAVPGAPGSRGLILKSTIKLFLAKVFIDSQLAGK